MSDQIPCPTCQATLRVPAGAAMIRCPKCKTVLAVEPAEDAAPPPAAPAKPFVPPLPFGRGAAKPAVPPPPAPPAKPARVSNQAPVRARLAPVPTEALAAGPRANETDAEAAQRRRTLAALDKLERQEERDKERYLEAAEHCRWGRTGLYLIAGGALANVAAAGLFTLFLISLVTVDGYPPLLGLSAVCLVAHFAATAGGFGCCAAGPPGVRGAALLGAACTVLQLVLAAAAASVLLKSVDMNALYQRSGDQEAFLRSGLLLSGVFNNLLTMAMLPLFVVMAVSSVGAAVPLKVLAVPVVAGVIEFAKLSLVGVVGNRLAVEAKGGELSHQAMRFVHRAFAGVVAAAVLFPLSVPLAFVLADALGGGKGGAVAVLALPVGAVQNGYYLWWVYTWFAQYHTLKDIAEVVVPGRVTYKGDHLEAH